MKKLILTVTAMVGASMVAYSQGSVGVGNLSANGYVIDAGIVSHTASSSATYVQATSFTVQLWALPGNVTTVAGLAGLDSYGYLATGNLVSDGFVQVANIGNIHGGTTGQGNGLFASANAASVVGSTGAFPYSTAGSDVIALVAWTGTFANLAAAIAGNASVGILAFVNPLGPGGANPNVPDDSIGWNALQNSPLSAAHSGSQDFILTQPVPEPSTLALAGLGGLASLMAIRRKKA